MAKKIIGDVNLSDLYLKQLPEILKDVSIDGDFFCSNNLWYCDSVTNIFVIFL